MAGCLYLRGNFVSFRFSLIYAQNYRIQMERIGVLINKLGELYQQNASPEQLIHVVRMLQTELLLPEYQQQKPNRKKIAVMMPGGFGISSALESPGKTATEDLDLPGVTASEINFENDGREEKKPRSVPVFNVLEEVPTLAHQPGAKEINEVIGKTEPSLNEKLFEQKKELAEKLTEEPLKDIKKAIGVNDRYIFITELFRGDENMYERSLKTINRFSIYPEAEFWISRELKLKLGWQESHPAVKQFDQLVRRRFL